MIIDCHGHYTTAPKELEAFRQQQIAALGDPPQLRTKGKLTISDDQIRESLEKGTGGTRPSPTRGGTRCTRRWWSWTCRP